MGKGITDSSVSFNEIVEDNIGQNLVQATGDYYDFRNAIGFRESTDNYEAMHGTHIGRYQMGTDAFKDIGFMDSAGNWTEEAKVNGITSQDDFLSNPDVQDMAFDMYVKVELSYIKAFGLDQYIGQEMNGIMITESGLLAAVHLVGIGDAREAFNSHDLTSKNDELGTTVKDYVESFGGYNIDAVK